MSKKNSAKGFSNFGFSTIVFSFVMICVVTFSALSLTTAYSDYKLSKKMADKNTAYYEAQLVAYEKLADIDNALVVAYKEAASEDEYFSIAEHSLTSFGYGTYENKLFTYQEEIGERQTLSIIVEVQYPTTDEETFLQILEWKSVYEEVIPEDGTLDLVD